MSQVTSVADAVSAPVAGSDPTPRSASLRFGVGSLNPGSIHGRRRRRGASPLRCPREGRCGAGAPVAHASSQVLGSRRRGFPRVAVLRLAPLRCARSTRPPLGPLGDRGRRFRCEAFPSRRPRSWSLPAPSCRGEGRACPSEAARASLTGFYPAGTLPEGYGPERRSEWLRTPQESSAPGVVRAPHLRSERGRAAAAPRM